MADEIAIEKMSPETVGDAAGLELQCFSAPWSVSALKAELENPQAVFRTARVGGKIAGYAGMHDVAGEGYITNIAVSPDFRRRGIARALMESLLEYCRENGLSMITLEVREGNEAARMLYESYNFCVTGKRKNFYTHPAEDAVIMTRELKEKFI